MKYYLIIALTFLTTAASADWLTPELLLKLGRVADPQLSPDGSKAVYIITRMDMVANRGNNDIWLYDFTNNSAKALTSDPGSETSPRWNNDGTRIYFIGDKDGSKIWSMNTDGGDREQVSNIQSDVNAFGISGNGKMIWVAVDVPLDKINGRDKYTDIPKTSGRVYDDLMMRHWNQWADGTYSHILVSPLTNGKMNAQPVDIMNGERFDSPLKPDGDENEIAWSRDGKQLAYTCKKLTGREYAVSTNSDIYLYDVSSRATTNITDGNPGYDKAPSFSPDGTTLAWISWEEAGNEASLQRLFITNLKTKEKKNLTDGFEYNVDKISWSGRSDRIYFISDINATDNIFYCDVFSKTSKPPYQLTHDEADYNGISVITLPNKEDVILASRMSMTYPTELFSIDVKSGNAKQLTRTNEDVLSSLTLAEVKKFMVKTTDNKDMLTWVIYPPNFNPKNKYPTLLYCQGGPQSTLSQFFSYRWNFQLMAANGYIVVAPCRRGMPGFGKAWNDEISNDWGGQAMNDMLSAIDSISKQPYVNKDRMGAVGASFGGYTVYWLEGHHQRRFKAFIAHCGSFNLESMTATEELFFHMHEYDGAYWRVPKPASYTKFSPHNFVQSWDTPILIIANERDYRVPYTQSLEAYSAARLKNIPARFLSFPDEGHWVLKPQNSLMWQREFFAWLDKYLK